MVEAIRRAIWVSCFPPQKKSWLTVRTRETDPDIDQDEARDIVPEVQRHLSSFHNLLFNDFFDYKISSETFQ